MKVLFSLSSAIFGQWTPPPWLQKLFSRIINRPLKTLAVVLLATGLSFGGWELYKAYENRPQPQTIAYTVEAPAITPLDNDLEPQRLALRFAASVAKPEVVGQAVETGISMTPTAAGTWRWISDSVLEFLPEEDWPAGQTYTITLDRGLCDDHVLLDKYVSTFQTPAFAAVVKSISFYQDPTDPQIRQIVTSLEFTHPVDPATLHSRISFEMQGVEDIFKPHRNKGQLFEIVMGPHQRTAHIRTAPLNLPKKEDFAIFRLAAGVGTSRGSSTTNGMIESKLLVPDASTFLKITKTSASLINNTQGYTEQILFIETTAPVRSKNFAQYISAILLPTKDPTNLHTKWTSPAEVDAQLSSRGEAISIEALPSTQEFSTIHTFRIRVPEQRQLYIRIKSGLPAVGNYQLSSDFDAIIDIPAYPSEVKFYSAGAVLALHGERKITLASRNVSTVRTEIHRVVSSYINHLVSQTEGNFRNPYFINDSFSSENISLITIIDQSLAITDPAKPNYSTLDFTEHLKPLNALQQKVHGLFLVSIYGWNPSASSTTTSTETQLVLVTDLGLIEKKHRDGTTSIFVQSIGNGQPVENATVEILGKNGVPIHSQRTDSSGQALLPNVNSFDREKLPVAYIVRKGDDLSFMPVNREDRILDYSRFATEGVEPSAPEELDGFIFTERGVYRPGDSLHGGLIIKQHNWAGNLRGIPVQVEIRDSSWNDVFSETLILNQEGFVEFSYKTEPSSTTGRYSVYAYLVQNGNRTSLLGSSTFHVEEFLPDRLKITSTFFPRALKGWLHPNELQARLTLQTLFGTPAVDHRITTQAIIEPSGFSFEEFADYQFHQPQSTTMPTPSADDESSSTRQVTLQLPDQQTDANGEVTFPIDLSSYHHASYRLTLTTEGFEQESGRSVLTKTSSLVSSHPYIIGAKPDGDLNFIRLNSERSLHLISLNPNLEKISPTDPLTLRFVEVRYISVLTKQPSGSFAYSSVPQETEISAAPLTIGPDGAQIPLFTKNPGRYFLNVTNADGVSLAKIPYEVVGDGPLNRELEKNAELHIKLSATEFQPNDEIEIQITAPYTGSGLITIERDKVYATKWFKTTSPTSLQKITVPADFEGTGYINVTFLRGLDSKEIFMSPLSYATAPFEVKLPIRTIPITLSTPNTARPGQPLKIGYQTDRPCKIVIFAVDEGILQVTRYKLPEPNHHFQRKHALQVRTSQILDELFPEYSIVRASMAPGGDEGEDDLNRNLNPFRRITDAPVVFWSGILNADSQAREVTYNVPDYFNGTLTVMAVAVAPNGIGADQRQPLVRAPFVIQPNAPMFVAPGDEFEIPIVVTNMIEGSGKALPVNFEIKTSEHLEIISIDKTSATIDEGRDVILRLRARSRQQLGSAEISCSARSGEQHTTVRTTTSVRPAVAYVTRIQSGYVRGKSHVVKIKEVFLPEHLKLEVSAAETPLGLAHGLASYLEDFAHLCTEQLVSKGWPTLMQNEDFDLGITTEQTEKSLSQLTNTLRTRQRYSGSFNYWPSEQIAEKHLNFITLYTMDFLTSLQTANHAVPTDMLNRGLSRLEAMSKEEASSLLHAREIAYAIYILTQHGRVTTNYLINLRAQLEKKWPREWPGTLTSLYLAGTYALLQQTEQAEKLISTYRIQPAKNVGPWNDFYSTLGEHGQYLSILSQHFPERLAQLTSDDLLKIVEPIQRGEFNTLSAAYIIKGIADYSRIAQGSAASFTIDELDDKKSSHNIFRSDALGAVARAPFSNKAASLVFSRTPDPTSPLPGFFYQVMQRGFPAQLPNKEEKNKLQVTRQYLDLKGQEKSSAIVGEEILVRISVRALGKDSLTNVAIVDLLPAGFESITDSIRTRTENNGSWVTHIDRREDRVVLYGHISPTLNTFEYRIKATNAGRYALPPIQAESMYDRSAYARSAAGTIVIHPLEPAPDAR